MKKLSYISHIDTLRALAVLFVILFHLDLNLFPGGFIGVDIFFVISGFLITRILRHEYEEIGRINLKLFYTRRIRRLMPTLFLTIGLTFILTFLIFSPSDFISATRSMFMSSIASSNFHFLGEAGYFDTASNFKPMLHTWSLGVEEQFYIIYPITLFLILKLFRKRKLGTTISLVTLLLLSLTLTIYTSDYGVPDYISNLFLPKDALTSGSSSLHFYLFPFRMFEFLIGGTLALKMTPVIKSDRLKLTFHITALLIIIASAVLLSKDSTHLSILNLIPCLGAGILLYIPTSKALSFLYKNKFLNYIGKISYTLYLIHWPIITIYRYVYDQEFRLIEQVGLFVLILLLSSLIYKHYETPLRYTKAKFSIKSNVSLIVIIVFSIISIYGISSNINKNKGWLWRLDEQSKILIVEIGAIKDYHKNNWGGAGYQPGWIGPYPGKGISPDMIWLGDSNAGHYLYGLDSILVKQNKKTVYISNWSSSLKLPDIIRNDNSDQIENSIELFKNDVKLVDSNKNSTIVLSQAWSIQLERSEVFNFTTQKYEKFTNHINRYKLLCQKINDFHQLIGTDRKLIIIGATPTTGANQLNYIEKILRPKYISHIAPMSKSIPHNQAQFIL